MNEQEIKLLTEKYEQAKAANDEICHRADHKKTAGQVIRIEERYRTLEETCKDLGIDIEEQSK